MKAKETVVQFYKEKVIMSSPDMCPKQAVGAAE